MLVKAEGAGRSNQATRRQQQQQPQGILDSPTLARVERAMLRHGDGGGTREGAAATRTAYTQVSG